MNKYSKDPETLSKLSPEQYRVTQESCTERPGTGAHLRNKEPGIYVDVVSGEPLFASSDKYDSGSGWPSFTKPIEKANISELPDPSHGAAGVEVRSAHGDSHLGHVFERWPEGARRPTLLHQLGLVAIHPPGRHGGRGLRGLPKSGRGCSTNNKLTESLSVTPQGKSTEHKPMFIDDLLIGVILCGLVMSVVYLRVDLLGSKTKDRKPRSS